GRIVSIDTAPARTYPGIVAAWTSDDLGAVPPIDFRDDRVEALVPFRQPVLARGRVRYVGDPVAVVFADDPYRAEDAAEAVVVEFDELPPVLCADGDPGEFDKGLSTEPMIIRKAYGEIDLAFQSAHAIVALDLAIGRHSGMLPGPYRIPAYRAAGHYRLTNKTPAATYRSPGRYESTFVRERLMDAIAEKIGIDRVEVRRRNLIDKSEMPFERPLHTLGDEVVLDSGDYAGLLDKALQRLEWSKLQAKLMERRRAGEAVGVGLALFVEKSGLGPSDGVRIAVES